MHGLQLWKEKVSMYYWTTFEISGGQYGKKNYKMGLESCLLAIQKSIRMDEELFTKIIYE